MPENGLRSLAPHRNEMCRREWWSTVGQLIKRRQIIIPNDEKLIAQLTSRRKLYDSKGREKLESKADLRARGVEHGFVTGPGEIAEGSRPAGNVFGRILDQSSDMLELDHRVTCIVEPLGAMFDPKDVVLEVLSIGFNCGGLNVRTQGRGNAKHFPEMRLSGADSVELAEGLAGRAHK